MRTRTAMAIVVGVGLMLLPSLASAQSAAPVTITILEHQANRITALNAIKPMCEASMAEQGMNVTLDIQDAQVADDTEFQTKLPILYQGDSPPDVTSYPGAWVPGFAAAGYLADLTDRLNGWADWKDHFYPVLRDRTVQADGKSYSMPRGRHRHRVLRAQGRTGGQRHLDRAAHILG